jgi:hypothetical protein
MEDFEGAKLYKLFPQHVIAVCLQRDIAEEEITFATKVIGKRDVNVLDATVMAYLRRFIQHQLHLYVKNVIKPRNEVGLRITTSWSCLGSDEHPAISVNSYLSGLLYLRAEKAHDIVRFYSNKQPDGLYLPSYLPDDFNTDACDIGVDGGYLFLFPSRVARKSVVSPDGLYIGFNTFPFGWLGDAGERDSVWID